DYLKRNGVAPVRVERYAALFALADPFDEEVTRALRLIFGAGLELAVATDRDIEAAFARHEAEEDDGAPELVARVSVSDMDAERLTELANDAPTIKYIESLFAKAIENRATDIHVEAMESGPRVRLRIDGMLIETDPPERTLYDGMVSRLKILADMDISERRLPQDGRIRQKAAGRPIDMRVATAPTVHGESMVLRLLDTTSGLTTLDDIQLPGPVQKTLRSALRQPNGLILVTGPTGSGKTTTLHAAMGELNDAGRKIVTIENPVEVQTPGLIQIEVNPELGWTFAAALRTVLRHDPDVLMVGEIRDAETAELAVRAAMTGHLVLSTLHTNRAQDAILRLVDMGVPEYLLSSVVRMVGAQRLVRTLCDHCKAPLDLSKAEKARIMYDRLAKVDPTHGSADDWNIKRAVGCDHCNQTGYAGRMAVFEAMNPSNLITTGGRLPKPDRTMGHEGLALVAQGHTTLDELIRVFGVFDFWK
ncbi:MAG: GspE/PulE family protein, partial [Pseudomonadota bacterium]